jgi:hypothetical protein
MHEKIPPQQKGAKTDTKSEVNFESPDLARAHFQTVKKRFLDINSWELFAGEEKAEFALRDSKGTLLLREPAVGDYVTIKIPGLHNTGPDGYDWVQIEELDSETSDLKDCAYIRVRPVANPTVPEDSTAHFFGPEATSNFLIWREDKTVGAEVHGRNEIPNTEDVSLLEKIRNGLVAIGGMFIASEFQWSSFTDGLLKHEK